LLAALLTAWPFKANKKLLNIMRFLEVFIELPE
jgi:hypothetical protein